MNNKFVRICMMLAMAGFAYGCGESGEHGSEGDRTVTGVSQKGPFRQGSSVTVQELKAGTLAQTGSSFKGRIQNNRGEFSIASVPLASQYVMLEVNGYYRNEVTGSDSGPITMNALVDISDRDNVNINLLTHLESDRVMHLVTTENLEFAQAKKQARQELMNDFGFSGEFGNAEDMDIFGTGADSAALLAISIITQGYLSESDFSARITGISSDVADGTINNDAVWMEMARWASQADLGSIRQNMESWGEQVPEFEPYIKTYWKTKFGLTSCPNVGEIKNYEGMTLVCHTDGWDKADHREILNYVLGPCENQGEVKKTDSEALRNGNSYVYFVCRDNAWREADEQDILRLELGPCENQGEIKKWDSPEYGNGDGSYVCRDQNWQHASDQDVLVNALGACNHNGEIKQSSDYDYLCSNGGFFVCNASIWNCADEEFVELYQMGTCQDGDIQKSDKYGYIICRGNHWGLASGNEILMSQLGPCTNDEMQCVSDPEFGSGCYKCFNEQWSPMGYDDIKGYVKEHGYGTCGREGQHNFIRISGGMFDGYFECVDNVWRYLDIEEIKMQEFGRCENEGEVKYSEKLDIKVLADFMDIVPDYIGLTGYFYCGNGQWNATSDTNQVLGNCDEQGKKKFIRWEAERGKLYVCRAMGWDLASAQEYQDYFLGSCDASHNWEVKWYHYYQTFMTCKSGKWDYSSSDEINAYLGDCERPGEYRYINNITNEDAGEVFYVCSGNGSWRVPITNGEFLAYRELEKYGCANDGQYKNYNSGNYFYVCDGDTVRLVTEFERTKLNKLCMSQNRGESLEYMDNFYMKCGDNGWVPDIERNSGKLVDTRDNTEYRTVVIGTQTWMAENLRYSAPNPVAYDYTNNAYAPYVQKYDILNSACFETQSECQAWGRVYNIMELGSGGDSQCPSGYHLPSQGEWEVLMSFVDSIPSPLTYSNNPDGDESHTKTAKLKSTSGWANIKNYYEDGEDLFGFTALPTRGEYDGPDIEDLYAPFGKIDFQWGEYVWDTETNIGNYDTGIVGAFYWASGEIVVAISNRHNELNYYDAYLWRSGLEYSVARYSVRCVKD